jgi:hypothetical protein
LGWRIFVSASSMPRLHRSSARLALAPGSAEVALLAGRMETTRGRLDEGIARLRRAVDLETSGVRARMALARRSSAREARAPTPPRLRLLDEVAARVPMNLAVLLERARLTAKGTDGRTARRGRRTARTVRSRMARAGTAAVRRVADGGACGCVSRRGVRATLLLRNVLTRVPTFIEGLTAVRTPPELVSEPFVRFQAMQPASAMPSPADASGDVCRAASGTDPADATAVAWLDHCRTARGARRGSRRGATRFDASGRRWSLPVAGQSGRARRASAGGSTGIVTSAPTSSWPPATGSASWLQQSDGQFRARGAARRHGSLRLYVHGRVGPPTSRWTVTSTWSRAWRRSLPWCFATYGDGTWRPLRPFAGVESVLGFAWADIDQDADPDAVFLDASGRLSIFANRQAGQFTRVDRQATSASRWPCAVGGRGCRRARSTSFASTAPVR